MREDRGEERGSASCHGRRALGGPRLALANHFDAFRNPLGPAQMDIGDDGRADLAAFAEEIRACAPGARVVVPEHGTAIPI